MSETATDGGGQRQCFLAENGVCLLRVCKGIEVYRQVTRQHVPIDDFEIYKTTTAKTCRCIATGAIAATITETLEPPADNRQS